MRVVAKWDMSSNMVCNRDRVVEDVLQIKLGRVWVAEGAWEKEWKRIGRALEQTRSRRTWLQLVHCALMHTVSYFGKLIRQKRN